MILLKKSHPVAQAMSARPITQAELLEAGQYRNPGEPNAEQSASSEYSKPSMKWRGLTIAIENPAGSVRRGRNRHGVTWEQRMLYDYGEILGSMGVDGDPVDVFIGPNLDAPKVYVVHQRRVNDWDNYDEDKCLIGFDSEDEARAAFLSCYSDPRFLGPITTMIVDDFVAKVRATKEKPAMIKSILFFKGFVGPYLRGGKIVNVSGYHGRNARAKPSPGQMSLFGSNTPMGPSPYKGKDPVASTPDMFADDVVTTPRDEMIAEHKRLVQVLNSPSHEDDKIEAKKQAAELKEYREGSDEMPAIRPYSELSDAEKAAYDQRNGITRGQREASGGEHPIGRLYHGTATAFSKFDPSKMGTVVGYNDQGAGIYLTTDRDGYGKYFANEAAGKVGQRGGEVLETSLHPSTKVLDAKNDQLTDEQVSAAMKLIDLPENRKNLFRPQELRDPMRLLMDVSRYGRGESDIGKLVQAMGFDAVSLPEPRGIEGVKTDPNARTVVVYNHDKVKIHGAKPTEASEPDHLLADIPGAKWRRGKGLIAGHYGVDVNGEVVGNYHAKPEDAVAEAKQTLANRDQWAKDKAARTEAIGKLRDRLMSGGEATDQDLQLLGLRAGSSGLEWFIPAAAEAFGVNSRAVRPHIRDLIRIGHTDMGAKKEFVEPKKALQALAAGLKPNADYNAAVTSTKEGPTDDNPRRKFYVTMAREGRGVAKLAGPFDTHDEAKAHVHRAREAAHQVDPRSAFDAFGTAGIEADEHKPGVLNERLGIGAKPTTHTPVTTDDHPAPIPRSLLSMIPEDRLDEWKDLHRQQHELHHYELGQVREKLDRLRSKRNKAESAMNEAEAGVRAIRSAPVPDPEREADAQKFADKARADFTKLTREQDGLVGQHQSLYERIAKLGRAKERIAAGSGELDVDFAAMRKRTASEQQEHEKSMLKMYREHYKAKDAERKSGKPSTSQPQAEKSGPEVKTMMSAGTYKNWLKVVPRLGKVNGWDLFHDKLNGERFVLMTSYNSVGFDSEAEAREWAAQNKANPRGDFNGAPMTKSIVFLRRPVS